jgi:nitronate monooxygenase
VWSRTLLTDLFGVELPIVLAPLGGGPGTAELAAAVSDAGGLGMLGLGYVSPDAARKAVRDVRRLTGRPFGANIFVPRPYAVDEHAMSYAVSVLAPLRRSVGLDDEPVVERYAEDFDAQLEVLLDERVPVVGFVFGVPATHVVEAVHAAGAVVVGTATTVDEGSALRDAGVDVVCAQGAEAGGHRGTFLDDPAAGLVGTMALVPELVDRLGVPVIASGGVMDGRGIVAALALGASAVQLGTAFLRCPEAGTSPPYREALRHATATSTVVTRAFSGKPARGVRNAFVERVPADAPVPDYPVMNALTRELRSRAATLGRADLLSLWAGQGVGLGREMPAGELVRALVSEVEAVLARLARAD